ncbi:MULTISPECIES: fibronectin type III domain-containing protein [unclassified Curtobacterium]|uniref:fibronectin type III domain-containing protein n=1 Tax=unclassified Curtobacterium TaxID=257496 RepID=UPI000FC03A9B|nr:MULTISPECIES: fibronectin type III domain-containing protein [unclassified Curtobacterium]ROQ17427.1 fibronectin type III domain protein [Curtobacterium sp. PhB171]ROQ29328.1 fibronectin type III domain protein [Curtobacterium sp. PhB170]ROS45526.1 fibronectin type III domain protein [Curtobacterium sp. PhB131]ROS65766.1 fibronectin type III domain protein [Curtobacterium sp. PhB141]
MYRALITVAAAAALVIGGVAPATAAPSSPSSAPGAPTSVRVSGAADSATVTWGAPKSGAKVTGWTVAIAPVQQQPDAGVDRLPAKARSDRFGDLTPKTTYTFSVRAVSGKMTGRAVAVRYTAPAVVETTQSLFALDASGNVVRFAEDGSGTGKVVAANGTGFAADDVGDVFTPSADHTSILFHPADGSAARTLATGLHLTPDLRSDVAGNLYWIDSVNGSVQKLPVGSSTAATAVTFPAAQNSASRSQWAVGRDGTVSAYTSTATGGLVNTASPTATVTKRTVAFPAGQTYGYLSGLLADGSGTLYVSFQSPGGSGYFGWYALPARATAFTVIEPRIAFEYAAVNSTDLTILQSAQWCAAISEGSPGGCHVDRTLTHQFVRNASGATTERTTSGITANGRAPYVGATDAQGDVFVAIDGGATPGLWRVPASGGAAQQLSSAQYSRLLVI